MTFPLLSNPDPTADDGCAMWKQFLIALMLLSPSAIIVVEANVSVVGNNPPTDYPAIQHAHSLLSLSTLSRQVVVGWWGDVGRRQRKKKLFHIQFSFSLSYPSLWTRKNVSRFVLWHFKLWISSQWNDLWGKLVVCLFRISMRGDALCVFIFSLESLWHYYSRTKAQFERGGGGRPPLNMRILFLFMLFSSSLRLLESYTSQAADYN